MSEKRFIVKSEKIGRFHNIFVQTDKIEYLLTGDFDNDSEMMKEIVDKLNEQQVTISALKEENEQLQKVCSYLKKENQSLIDNIFDIYEKVKWVGR